ERVNDTWLALFVPLGVRETSEITLHKNSLYELDVKFLHIGKTRDSIWLNFCKRFNYGGSAELM
ncbi:hypothetical protein RUM43_010166, partial [Polyplax serrata]